MIQGYTDTMITWSFLDNSGFILLDNHLLNFWLPSAIAGMDGCACAGNTAIIIPQPPSLVPPCYSIIILSTQTRDLPGEYLSVGRKILFILKSWILFSPRCTVLSGTDFETIQYVIWRENILLIVGPTIYLLVTVEHLLQMLCWNNNCL